MAARGRAGTDRFSGNKAFEDFAVIVGRFSTQVSILKAVNARFESSLFDIRQVVQADLVDLELDAAQALLKSGFLRASGVIGGVVIEKHLQEVCSAHKVTIRKKNPTIGDLNDSLKAAEVMDIPMWRYIQRLGDLRNLCGHQKEREPTKEEVCELIEGGAKVTKSVY